MNENTDYPPIPMSQDHIAKEFAKKIAGKWCYVHDYNKWYHYHGQNWQLDRGNEILDMALRFCREAVNWKEAKLLTESKKRSISSSSYLNSLLYLTKSDRLIATTSEKIGLPPPKNKNNKGR